MIKTINYDKDIIIDVATERNENIDLLKPDFATSFFQKSRLSQCSRGAREKSAIIFGDYISEHLDRRLQCRNASFRVQYIFVADAESRQDAAYVLPRRIQQLVVFAGLA